MPRSETIGNPNKKSAKKLEQQKAKRLATEKRGKRVKRQERRDAKDG